MSLTAENVNRIAWLARVAINADQVESYAHDLSGILDFVAQMDGIDTRTVQPMAHPMEQIQRLRPDIPSEPDQRDAFQRHAPRIEAGLYLVPKVIE
ncbi:MAG: Asp-tRNA(Asn)/Glu-tRNA(Gln) amidotransferase subunit GatC [Methylococcaceae bacterium]